MESADTGLDSTDDKKDIQHQSGNSHDTNEDNLCTQSGDSDEGKIDKSKRKSEKNSGDNDTLKSSSSPTPMMMPTSATTTTTTTTTTPRVNSPDLNSESLSTIIQEHINRFIGRGKHNHRISKHDENDGDEPIDISGHCEFCTKAQITTMEPHFGVSPHIGEFWSTITSITYHLIFLLLFIPYTSWWQPWQEDKCLPKTLLITIYLSVITGFVSFIYHMFLWEGFGCIDCVFATIAWISMLLAAINARIEIYLTKIIVLILVFAIFWRKSTTIAALVCIVALPITVYLGMKADTGYSKIATLLIFLGSLCFLFDRTKLIDFPYFHSLWHICSGLCMWFSGLQVAVHGPMYKENIPFINS